MIRALIWIPLPALLAVGACTHAPSRDPAVMQDVLAYVAKIRKWESVEVEVLRAIRDVKRSQYVDDDYVISTLGGVMDDVELHLEEVARYQPRTAPVKEVHERYRVAWRDLHDSFAEIIAATERKDYLELSKGTQAMARSRDELITVAAALNLLLKQTGLKEEDAGAPAASERAAQVSGDALEEVAELIAAVGRCYQRGRRYRAIATLCEERTLARALEIGTTVRQAARNDRLEAAAVAAARDTLRALLGECEAAVAGVRASDLYRRAARAWEEGHGAETAALAPAIFAAVEPYLGCPTLYHPVSVAQRRGGGEHFVPPAACAAAIAALARDGIAASTTPELGADETIRAVFLSDDPEVLESPVALTIEPATLGLPACRIAAASDAVLYVARLRVPFRVRCAAAVTDEWWAVYPDAYARYVGELRTELTARGIPLAESGQ